MTDSVTKRGDSLDLVVQPNGKAEFFDFLYIATNHIPVNLIDMFVGKMAHLLYFGYNVFKHAGLDVIKEENVFIPKRRNLSMYTTNLMFHMIKRRRLNDPVILYMYRTSRYHAEGLIEYTDFVQRLASTGVQQCKPVIDELRSMMTVDDGGLLTVLGFFVHQTDACKVIGLENEQELKKLIIMFSEITRDDDMEALGQRADELILRFANNCVAPPNFKYTLAERYTLRELETPENALRVLKNIVYKDHVLYDMITGASSRSGYIGAFSSAFRCVILRQPTLKSERSSEIIGQLMQPGLCRNPIADRVFSVNACVRNRVFDALGQIDEKRKKSLLSLAVLMSEIEFTIGVLNPGVDIHRIITDRDVNVDYAVNRDEHSIFVFMKGLQSVSKIIRTAFNRHPKGTKSKITKSDATVIALIYGLFNKQQLNRYWEYVSKLWSRAVVVVPECARLFEIMRILFEQGVEGVSGEPFGDNDSSQRDAKIMHSRIATARKLARGIKIESFDYRLLYTEMISPKPEKPTHVDRVPPVVNITPGGAPPASVGVVPPASAGGAPPASVGVVPPASAGVVPALNAEPQGMASDVWWDKVYDPFGQVSDLPLGKDMMDYDDPFGTPK